VLTFQVRSTPYDPRNPHVEENAQRKAIAELSKLPEGTILIAQVYADSVIGFENRLLFVSEKFDTKSNRIAVAGIPYASNINGIRYSGLSVKKIPLEDITDMKVLETDENVKVKTRDGEAVEGRVYKANFVRDKVFIGKNSISKLEIELLEGTDENMVKHIVEFADIESIQRKDKGPAKVETFPAYNL
jgi:hypothetical protein